MLSPYFRSSILRILPSILFIVFGLSSAAASSRHQPRQAPEIARTQTIKAIAKSRQLIREAGALLEYSQKKWCREELVVEEKLLCMMTRCPMF